MADARDGRRVVHHPEHRIAGTLQVQARQGLARQAREQFAAHVVGDALRQADGETQIEQPHESVRRTGTRADPVLRPGRDIRTLRQIRLEQGVAGIADE